MNTQTTTQNPKCNTCKCFWKPADDDVKSDGLIYKSCKRCRQRSIDNRCEHNRVKSKCIECGGGSICEHNREKSKCKECCGSSICEHNKYKSTCKECGGGSICEHNREKSRCKECGGGSICEHNKYKSTCKECGGSQICEHNREKSRCKECGGSQICEHNRVKSRCKECNFKLCLVNIQRQHINRCFKSSTLDKTKHSVEYLDCSVESLIEHFNKKMEYFNTYLATDTIMTWDNVHIDHIKPVSVFKLDDENEFLDCCHYTNLQPLISNDNLEKSNKWTDENNKYWLENIRGNDKYLEIYF